jgi:hypothetical protein
LEALELDELLDAINYENLIIIINKANVTGV